MNINKRWIFVIFSIILVSGASFFYFQQNSTNQSSTNHQSDNTIDIKETLFHQNKTTNIVAIGDSLTQGVGDSKKQGGYVGILKSMLLNDNYNVNVENYGKAGDRTDQLLEKIKTEEIKSSIQKADAVLITIGANDIMKVLRNNITDINFEHFESEKPNYGERLQEIFSTLQNYNKQAEIYLLGFYNPFNLYFGDIPELEMIINEWNDLSEAITEDYDKIKYIPTKDLFNEINEDVFADDHFHPNDFGYEKMAERVYETITE